MLRHRGLHIYFFTLSGGLLHGSFFFSFLKRLAASFYLSLEREAALALLSAPVCCSMEINLTRILLQDQLTDPVGILHEDEVARLNGVVRRNAAAFPFAAIADRDDLRCKRRRTTTS